MSTAAPWRPGDGRSRRSDRVPTDMRVLGRILPASPWRIVDEMPNAMALQQLHSMFQHAGACIGQHIPALEGVLSMSTGHYTETLGVAFGTDLRELLSPGAYIITDSSAAQRVMYVGSSVDGCWRRPKIDPLTAIVPIQI